MGVVHTFSSNLYMQGYNGQIGTSPNDQFMINSPTINLTNHLIITLLPLALCKSYIRTFIYLFIYLLIYLFVY